ncbi:MAG: hypothetical protein COA78_07420 [Blastopirellula sp.]|nr:MAG: hypothetical protein COA78_07420 [Blastopirellula sp.]
MMFLNTLGPLSWALLLIIPPAILALYFLKLRRQPLEVPSTYLWRRTIEDLHVNSLWQKLRQSILLFLQLLFIFLIIIACLRPGFSGSSLDGDRFIFLIDNSASMNATDVEDAADRLSAAKNHVADLIDQMKRGDVAMILSFSNRAKIVHQYTNDRRKLLAKLKAIEPTNRTSDISEALRVASGLANPGQSSFEEGDEMVAESKPATMYIFSDGQFPSVQDFSLGNLNPIYFPIGNPISSNLAIVAFSTQRNPERENQLQAYARIERYGDTAPTEVEASLYYNGDLLDVSRVSIPEDGAAGVQFDLGTLEAGKIKLELDVKDDFALDNVAYAAINPPRKAKVLVVTSGNEYLQFALATDEIEKISDVAIVDPTFLEGDQYKAESAIGAYDLVIYEQCAPETMPNANTLFIGMNPPSEGWSFGETANIPQIIDTTRSHPIMSFIDLGNVSIYEANAVNAPQGATTLIDSDIGSLFTIAPREGYEDAVLGFAFLAIEDGKSFYNTEWTKRLSFPVFVKNIVEYLGNIERGNTGTSIRPGAQFNYRTEAPMPEIHIKPPSGKERTIGRHGQNMFSFSETEMIGTYDVREGAANDARQHFSVNIFNSQESNIIPSNEIQTEWEVIEGKSQWSPVRKELWKLLIVFAIIVLIVEWYIYNRRVYL